MKKLVAIIFAAGFLITGVILAMPKTQAAGTSPVTIAAQQSSGNFGIGPASIKEADITNLRNEANALGVWMDENIQSLQSVCE